MIGYEQPAKPCTPRDELERERRHIAEQTAAFLAAGGEISRPGPRVLRLEVPTDRRAATTRVYADGAAPPRYGTVVPNTAGKRRRRTTGKGGPQ